VRGDADLAERILQLKPRLGVLHHGQAQKALEAILNRYVLLYLATLIVLIPVDVLFLGMVARRFFTSEVGDMLGAIRLAPAILFYLLYVVGILVFVSGSAAADWQSTMLYGALFGFLLHDLRTHLAVAAQALDLGGGLGRCVLGRLRDRAVVDRGPIDRQLDHAEGLNQSFRGDGAASNPE
jgi:uncharacterized membrane protein